MKFGFFPKESNFFELFEEMAKTVAKAALILASLMEKWENVTEEVEKINELEHEGDSITHRVMAQLHSTFVTPLEREDIALLANRLDDILDSIQAATEAMALYQIQRPTPRAVQLALLIVKGASELEKTLPLLRHKKDLKQVLAHCIELNRIENETDTVYRSAVGELFTTPIPVDEIIKWREIYEQLENATDRCEDIADVLEGVILKHA